MFVFSCDKNLSEKNNEDANLFYKMSSTSNVNTYSNLIFLFINKKNE